jgi:NADH-quinone oxidoreductase subunit J
MPTVIQVIFALISALIIGAAMMVVLARNVIHAALWLIACFFGVGALYLLLEAEFLAVVQVLIYVGAISILILFAIMLTRQQEGARQLVTGWRLWATGLLCLALFAAVIVPTVARHPWNLPPPLGPDGTQEAIAGPAELGRGFVIEYLLQFQIAGVLLTVALVGAIVIAYEERSSRRRVLTLAEEHELRKRRAERPGGEPSVAESLPAPRATSEGE